MKIILSALALSVSVSASAATCVVKDEDGKAWFYNLPSKNGTFPKTLGYVSAAKPCPPDIQYTQAIPAPEPTPSDFDYVGYEKLYVNPTPTDANDCKGMKIEVKEKLPTGGYMVKVTFQDLAQEVDGKRTCTVK